MAKQIITLLIPTHIITLLTPTHTAGFQIWQIFSIGLLPGSGIPICLLLFFLLLCHTLTVTRARANLCMQVLTDMSFVWASISRWTLRSCCASSACANTLFCAWATMSALRSVSALLNAYMNMWMNTVLEKQFIIKHSEQTHTHTDKNHTRTHTHTHTHTHDNNHTRTNLAAAICLKLYHRTGQDILFCLRSKHLKG